MTGVRVALVASFLALLGGARRGAAQYPPEIHGQVVDALSKAGIPSAELRLSDGTRTLSDADGSFVLRALRPGTSELTIHRIGYASHRRTVELANGRRDVVLVELAPTAVALPELAAATDQPAAGTTVLDRARIERAGTADLGEILQQEPGVVVTRRGGPASPATVSIRGSSADQVLVLVDGVPLNNPLTGEADLSLVSLSAVERIAIMRGAQSARYGARALGGVIVVETRQAAAGELQATAGSGRWGTRHGAARVSVGRGTHRRFSGTVGAERRVFDGGFPVDVPVERGGGTGTRDNADASVWTVDGSMGFTSERFSSRVQGEFFDVVRGMPGTVVQPSASARQSQQRFGGGIDNRLQVGRGAATLGVMLQRQHATFADPTPPFGASYDQRARATTLVATGSLSQPIARGDWAAGVEARRLTVASNVLADAPHDPIDFAGLWTTFRTRSVYWGRWQFDGNAGLRGDVSTRTQGVLTSPQLGVNARRGRLTGEVRWARAYNAPSLADLFFQEGVHVEPNPDLQPERVKNEWTVSLTARDLAVGRLRGELAIAAYTAAVNGMIIWSPDFRYVWSPRNFDVHRRGAEMSGRLANYRGTFALTGALTLTSVEYAGPVLSGQVIYRPRISTTLGGEARLVGIETRLDYRYTGSRPTAIGSDLNALRPIHLVDLRLTRDIALGRGRVRLRGAVENVLDSRAGMLIDYPFPGRLVRAETTFFYPIGDL